MIHKDEDPYTLAVKGNADEDAYSPMDLFDWVELISSMKDEGYTQQGIGERIGWSRDKTKNHQRLLSEVGTNILEKAKSLQIGRVPSFGTNVAFNFTEGWFRNSGLYDLNEKYQERLMGHLSHQNPRNPMVSPVYVWE
ncbi:hypothetical protein [Ruoffia sp. FAM 20858]|uniref:hypothetical protein n=1 Tax=Ruoffia sp. FAM 20858 TaxID=3259516 RepID=UPI0038872221